MFTIIGICLVCLIQYSLEGNISKPNIVFILTDDQDLVLGGVTPMTKVQELISNMGATFSNAFATTPICCPSRSSILTGQYIHNHGAINNSVSGGCSSTSWQQQRETQTFATQIQENGYTTFYAGKYLNQYGYKTTGGTEHVPPGWDWWIGLVGNSRYYNYTLSVNGTAHYHSDDYLTDVIKNYGLEFLRQSQVVEGNFLMVLAPPAAHAPFTPAPEYLDRYEDVKAMRTPNFNTEENQDKHWLLRMTPLPLPDTILPTLDEIYHRRWETLLSVDDLVEAIINQLDSLNVLSNTYIIFSSDHGYHIGQFGLPWDKRQPYESDIRVPLFVRGPGVSSKTVINDPVLNIDFAPTFLAMAGLSSEDMDGKSFLNYLTGNEESTGRMFLVEYHGEGDDETIDSNCTLPLDNTLSECDSTACCKCQDSRNNTYACVRHLAPNYNYIYCKFDDHEEFEEVYNLDKDPYQLQNIANQSYSNVSVLYSGWLDELRNCRGSQMCNAGAL